MVKQIYRVLDKLRSLAIIIIFAGIILLCMTQVVLRYFTSATLTPFTWGDEIIRLASIWVVFLAASIGVRRGSHLSVEFFLEKYLSPKVMNIIKKVATGIVIIILVTIMVAGTLYLEVVWTSMLQNLAISNALFYAAIPVGCFYLIIEYVFILVYGKNPYVEQDAKPQPTEQEGE